TISQAFSKVALSSNGLLLSGILDIEFLNTLNSPIKEALKDLQLKPLPEGLIEFIIHYAKPDNANNADNASISVPFDTMIYFIKLRMPNLQSCFAKYNESSWRHYVLQPIVNFIADFKESDLCIRWDSVQSKASLERNNSIIVESENHSDLELLLGEISNGPFAKAQKHMKKDKIKLSKCGKDALDYIMRKDMKSQSNNLEKLNLIEKECKNINDSEVSENGEDDKNEKDDVGVENEDIIDR
ncbi:24591_t:CDS:2, partial [Gigaspora rosea]